MVPIHFDYARADSDAESESDSVTLANSEFSDDGMDVDDRMDVVKHHFESDVLWLPTLFHSVGKNIVQLTLGSIRGELNALATLPRGAFPRLERLVLGFVDPFEWENADWESHGPIEAFVDSPDLTHVALWRHHRSVEENHLLLPYEQLTYLLDHGTVYDTLDEFFETVLPRCQKLESLTIDISPGEHDASEFYSLLSQRTSTQKVTLPCLHSLTLNVTADIATSVLDMVELPNLEQWRMGNHLVGVSAVWLANHLTRFSRSLRDLRLPSHLHLDEQSLVAVLGSVPQLESLEIALSEELVKALTLCEPLDGHARSLLPQLTTLSVRYLVGVNNQFPEWLETDIPPFIRSRLRGCVPHALEVGGDFDNGGVRECKALFRFVILVTAGELEVEAKRLAILAEDSVPEGMWLDVYWKSLHASATMWDSTAENGVAEGWSGLGNLHFED